MYQSWSQELLGQDSSLKTFDVTFVGLMVRPGLSAVLLPTPTATPRVGSQVENNVITFITCS